MSMKDILLKSTILVLIALILPMAVLSAVQEDFSAFGEKADLNICACSNARYVLTIQNTGIVPNNYFLSQNGDGSKFSTLTQYSFFLEPGEIKQIPDFIQVPCETKGTFDLNTIITTQFNTKKIIQQKINVGKCSNFEIRSWDATQASVCAGQHTEFDVVLENTGTFIETFDLATDRTDIAKVFPYSTMIEPGKTKEATISVLPNKIGKQDITLFIKSNNNDLLKKIDYEVNSVRCIESGVEIDVDNSPTIRYGQNIIPVDIKNLATKQKTYDIYLEGYEWTQINAGELTLAPGQTQTIQITANLDQSIPKAKYPLRINVIDEDTDLKYSKDIILKFSNMIAWIIILGALILIGLVILLLIGQQRKQDVFGYREEKTIIRPSRKLEDKEDAQLESLKELRANDVERASTLSIKKPKKLKTIHDIKKEEKKAAKKQTRHVIEELPQKEFDKDTLNMVLVGILIALIILGLFGGIYHLMTSGTLRDVPINQTTVLPQQVDVQASSNNTFIIAIIIVLIILVLLAVFYFVTMQKNGIYKKGKLDTQAEQIKGSEEKEIDKDELFKRIEEDIKNLDEESKRDVKESKEYKKSSLPPPLMQEIAPKSAISPLKIMIIILLAVLLIGLIAVGTWYLLNPGDDVVIPTNQTGKNIIEENITGDNTTPAGDPQGSDTGNQSPQIVDGAFALKTDGLEMDGDIVIINSQATVPFIFTNPTRDDIFNIEIQNDEAGIVATNVPRVGVRSENEAYLEAIITPTEDTEEKEYAVDIILSGKITGESYKYTINFEIEDFGEAAPTKSDVGDDQVVIDEELGSSRINPLWYIIPLVILGLAIIVGGVIFLMRRRKAPENRLAREERRQQRLAKKEEKKALKTTKRAYEEDVLLDDLKDIKKEDKKLAKEAKKQAKDPEPKKSNKKLIALIILVIVLLGLIGAGIYFLMNTDFSGEEPIQKTTGLSIDNTELDVENNVVYISKTNSTIPIIIPSKERRDSYKVELNSEVSWITPEYTGVIGVRENEEGVLNLFVEPPQDIEDGDYASTLMLTSNSDKDNQTIEFIVRVGGKKQTSSSINPIYYYIPAGIAGIIILIVLIILVVKKIKNRTPKEKKEKVDKKKEIKKEKPKKEEKVKLKDSKKEKASDDIEPKKSNWKKILFIVILVLVLGALIYLLVMNMTSDDIDDDLNSTKANQTVNDSVDYLNTTTDNGSKRPSTLSISVGEDENTTGDETKEEDLVDTNILTTINETIVEINGGEFLSYPINVVNNQNEAFEASIEEGLPWIEITGKINTVMLSPGESHTFDLEIDAPKFTNDRDYKIKVIKRNLEISGDVEEKEVVFKVLS